MRIWCFWRNPRLFWNSWDIKKIDIEIKKERLLLQAYLLYNGGNQIGKGMNHYEK